MGRAMFYHLTRQPLEDTLPGLLNKALQAGWRVAVRGTDRARLEWLDERLWLQPQDGFLPHGLAGGPHDPDQPVLLTDSTLVPNGAACLMTIDDAPVEPAEAAAFERVCILFDGHDAAAVAGARARWSALVKAGIHAQYWSEESGRWQMQAERVPG